MEMGYRIMAMCTYATPICSPEENAGVADRNRPDAVERCAPKCDKGHRPVLATCSFALSMPTFVV